MSAALGTVAPMSKGKASNRPNVAASQQHLPFDVVIVQAPDGTVPMEVYLESIPPQVAARIVTTAEAVADAPPYRFAGGGRREVMHGDMTGWYEIRVRFGSMHYRVFCLLDQQAKGRGPLLVMVDGRTKPNATLLPDREYTRVRELGEFYLDTQPRPIA